MEAKTRAARAINMARTLARLFAVSAKMDIAWLLQDTRFAAAAISSDVIANVSALSGVFLIASRFGGLGGALTVDEVLFMMAYSTLTTGLFNLFGSGNNVHVSRIIGRGQLDHLFMEPIPVAVHLLTCGFCPATGFANLAVGAGLLVYASNRLGVAAGPVWIAALAAYLLATLATIAAQSYLASSAAFWAPVAAEEISSSVIDGTWLLSTFPLTGMPFGVQAALLTVLPEGLLAWFPAMCLLGKPPFAEGMASWLSAHVPWLATNVGGVANHVGATNAVGVAYIASSAYPLAFAAVLSLAASRVFRIGMRRYLTKGINRYVPFGFRN